MTEIALREADLAPIDPAPVTLFRSDNPREIIGSATAVADELAKVVRKQKLTTKIQGRDHVRVEGWTLLGTMLGVFPVLVWSRKHAGLEARDYSEEYWEARVEARTMAGQLVGAAEAMCSRSEKTWANRDDYALRSMAQTRATSKALRQPLGFVMTLAGFEATPAEEMIVEAEYLVRDDLPPARVVTRDVPDALAPTPDEDAERAALVGKILAAAEKLGKLDEKSQDIANMRGKAGEMNWLKAQKRAGEQAVAALEQK
jgi:hypothetical protein